MVETSDKTSPSPEKHFVDYNEAGSIMYIQQPKGLPSACWGGLMSTRAQYLKAEGVIIDGRMRDIREHDELNFPVRSQLDRLACLASLLTLVKFRRSLLGDTRFSAPTASRALPGSTLHCNSKAIYGFILEIFSLVTSTAL